MFELCMSLKVCFKRGVLFTVYCKQSTFNLKTKYTLEHMSAFIELLELYILLNLKLG